MSWWWRRRPPVDLALAAGAAGAAAGESAAGQFGLSAGPAAVIGGVTAVAALVPGGASLITHRQSSDELQQSSLMGDKLKQLRSSLTGRVVSDGLPESGVDSRRLPAIATLLAQNDEVVKEWTDLLESYERGMEKRRDRGLAEAVKTLRLRIATERVVLDERVRGVLEIVRSGNVSVHERAVLLALSKEALTAAETKRLLEVIREMTELTIQEAVWLLLLVRLDTHAELEKILQELRNASDDDRAERVHPLLPECSIEIVAERLDTGISITKRILESPDKLETDFDLAIEAAGE